MVHIHNKNLWQKLLHNVPTTSPQVAYGTPEMANDITRLLATTNLNDDKILVMAGHQDGLIAFGKDLEQAANILLRYRDPDGYRDDSGST